jgi:cellobiose phosphorylase
MTAGPDAPTFGEGKNSWLTGTAAWSFVSATQYILGIKPDFDGLRIHPCLPSDCSGYKARRVFRGKTYRIEVRKPAGICAGRVKLTVDGQEIDGDVIPPGMGSETVNVLAEIQAD